MMWNELAYCANPRHCLCRPDVGSAHETMECEENQHAVDNVVLRLQTTLWSMILTDMIQMSKGLPREFCSQQANGFSKDVFARGERG